MDVTRIPKIELHLHLDGAVPPETMWRMAQEKHVSLPVDTLDEFYAWLVKTADCRDVNTYLARFELPLQLMQDAPGITRITYDVLTTLARQGHIYDELRFAPQLHTRAGLRQQDAIEAVLAGREQALRAFPDYRCGILLCCMCIGPETANMAENLETVRLTQEYLGSGVVGMDLAGAEGIVPLRNFHPIFDLARELGLPNHTGVVQCKDSPSRATRATRRGRTPCGTRWTSARSVSGMAIIFLTIPRSGSVRFKTASRWRSARRAISSAKHSRPMRCTRRKSCWTPGCACASAPTI